MPPSQPTEPGSRSGGGPAGEGDLAEEAVGGPGGEAADGLNRVGGRELAANLAFPRPEAWAKALIAPACFVLAATSTGRLGTGSGARCSGCRTSSSSTPRVPRRPPVRRPSGRWCRRPGVSRSGGAVLLFDVLTRTEMGGPADPAKYGPGHRCCALVVPSQAGEFLPRPGGGHVVEASDQAVDGDRGREVHQQGEHGQIRRGTRPVRARGPRARPA
jgi:hypothetical protein